MPHLRCAGEPYTIPCLCIVRLPFSMIFLFIQRRTNITIKITTTTATSVVRMAPTARPAAKGMKKVLGEGLDTTMPCEVTREAVDEASIPFVVKLLLGVVVVLLGMLISLGVLASLGMPAFLGMLILLGMLIQLDELGVLASLGILVERTLITGSTR